MIFNVLVLPLLNVTSILIQVISYFLLGGELDKVGNISFIEEQNSYTNKYRSQSVKPFSSF